jgi:hypothetical protein
LLVDLNTKLIEKTEELEVAKQKAIEFITKYTEQQNIANFKFDKSELNKLTTSQEVAQYVRQITNQIQQQKLAAQKKTNSSQKQIKTEKK